MGTMPGKGPMVKQTSKRYCPVCRERTEHYRWSSAALWTCVDVNSHPDVTDVRVLQARIAELEDEGLVLRGKIGMLLQMNQAALPSQLENNQPTLTEGMADEELQETPGPDPE